MTEQHYSFNKKSLRYEPISKGSSYRFIKALIYIGVCISVAVPICFLLIPTINTVQERLLNDENSRLQRRFDLLNKDLDILSSNLEAVEFRDDFIYRPLIDKEPVDSTTRIAGFGGVDHYSSFANTSNSKIIVSTLQRIDVLSKQIYVQSQSYNDVLFSALEREQKLHSIPAVQPISNNDFSYISSLFGYRSDPISGIRTFHSGIDFCAPIGVKVYATGDGVVRKAQKLWTGYGQHIIVDHGFGYETVYGHLNSFNVIEGQHVKRGEIIGFVGNTGKSTGPHLHYEVRVNGRAVNPKDYYQDDLTVSEYELVLSTSADS